MHDRVLRDVSEEFIPMGYSEEWEIISRALPREHVGEREWAWMSMSKDAFSICEDVTYDLYIFYLF